MTQESEPTKRQETPPFQPPEGNASSELPAAEAPRAISPGAQDLLAWEQAHPQEKPAEEAPIIDSRPAKLPVVLKSFSLSLSTSLIAIILAGIVTLLLLLVANRVLPATEPLSFAWVRRALQAVDEQLDKIAQQVEAQRNQPLDLESVREQGEKIEPPADDAPEAPAAVNWVKLLSQQAEKLSAWIERLKARTPSYNEIIERLHQQWEQFFNPE